MVDRDCPLTIETDIHYWMDIVCTSHSNCNWLFDGEQILLQAFNAANFNYYNHKIDFWLSNWDSINRSKWVHTICVAQNDCQTYLNYVTFYPLDRCHVSMYHSNAEAATIDRTKYVHQSSSPELFDKIEHHALLKSNNWFVDVNWKEI